jgi:nicotinic acid mononucleotide adenylyltransferase
MWKHFEELITENTFILFNRNNKNLKDEILSNFHLKNHLDKFNIINEEIPNVSSSEYRNTKNKEIVTKEVYEYIRENELY